MILCNTCINAIRSRGEIIGVIVPYRYTIDDIEQYNTEQKPLIDRHIINELCCNWCGEIDDLHECIWG